MEALLVTVRVPLIVRFDPPMPFNEKGDIELVAMETQPFDEDSGKMKVKEWNKIKKKVEGIKKVEFRGNETCIFQATLEELRQQFGTEHMRFMQTVLVSHTRRQISPKEFLQQIPNIVTGI